MLKAHYRMFSLSPRGKWIMMLYCSSTVPRPGGVTIKSIIAILELTILGTGRVIAGSVAEPSTNDERSWLKHPVFFYGPFFSPTGVAIEIICNIIVRVNQQVRLLLVTV